MGKAAEHAVDVLQKHVNDSGKVKALALALAVDTSTVYNWRAGKRGLGPDEVAALARYLRMTTDQLLGLRPPPDPPPVDVTAIQEHVDRVEQAAVTLAQAAGQLRAEVGAAAARGGRAPRK